VAPGRRWCRSSVGGRRGRGRPRPRGAAGPAGRPRSRPPGARAPGAGSRPRPWGVPAAAARRRGGGARPAPAAAWSCRTRWARPGRHGRRARARGRRRRATLGTGGDREVAGGEGWRAGWDTALQGSTGIGTHAGTGRCRYITVNPSGS
jgi:hypothetical protein